MSFKLVGEYTDVTEAYSEICALIDRYYGHKSVNNWRVVKLRSLAAKELLERGKFQHVGAQWGGKWGNYCRAIALNQRTGKYEYKEGFNVLAKFRE